MTWTTHRALSAVVAEGAGAPSSNLFAGIAAPPTPVDGGRHQYVEVAISDAVLGGTVAGSSCTLGVWRSSDGSIDKIGTLVVTGLNTVPVVFDFHGESIYVQVESFVGGTLPNISGTVRVRPVRL